MESSLNETTTEMRKRERDNRDSRTERDNGDGMSETTRQWRHEREQGESEATKQAGKAAHGGTKLNE